MYELILKNISRFIKLTEADESFFISLLKVKKLRKKQVLQQEGQIARYQYFINKGCLRTYMIDDKAQNISFSLLLKTGGPVIYTAFLHKHRQN